MGALSGKQTRSDETGFADHVSDTMGDTPSARKTEDTQAEEESMEERKNRLHGYLEYQLHVQNEADRHEEELAEKAKEREEKLLKDKQEILKKEKRSRFEFLLAVHRAEQLGATGQLKIFRDCTRQRQ